MIDQTGQAALGEFKSPGGFVFGVQGWTWGEQRPTSITFFLNGVCQVRDQHGRPIRGTVGQDGKPLYFERSTHSQVLAALEAERVDWRKLDWVGWPQLPYKELKEVANLPMTPLTELRKIKDADLRRDAVKMRREMEEAREKELALAVAAEDAD